jgi:hypothetical protein
MDDMQAGGGGEPEPGGARTSPIVLGLLCGFFFPLLPLFFLKAPPPPHAWPADAPPSVIFSCVRRALALVGVRADGRVQAPDADRDHAGLGGERAVCGVAVADRGRRPALVNVNGLAYTLLRQPRARTRAGAFCFLTALCAWFLYTLCVSFACMHSSRRTACAQH